MLALLLALALAPAPGALAHVVSIGFLAPLASSTEDPTGCAHGWQALRSALAAISLANDVLAPTMPRGADGARPSFALELLPADTPYAALISAAAFSTAATGAGGEAPELGLTRREGCGGLLARRCRVEELVAQRLAKGNESRRVEVRLQLAQ